MRQVLSVPHRRCVITLLQHMLFLRKRTACAAKSRLSSMQKWNVGAESVESKVKGQQLSSTIRSFPLS